MGLSQAELSERLRDRGLPWSQGTVSKVELGDRPVRLAEAPMLAESLEVEVEDLLSEDPLQGVLRESAAAAVRASQDIARASETHRRASMRAASARLMIAARDGVATGYRVWGLSPEYLIRRTVLTAQMGLGALEETLHSFGLSEQIAEVRRSTDSLPRLSRASARWDGDPADFGAYATGLLEDVENERDGASATAVVHEYEMGLVEVLADSLRSAKIEFLSAPPESPDLRRIEAPDGTVVEDHGGPGGRWQSRMPTRGGLVAP